ncbi:MAG TPA: hypothetical protein VI457_09930 [Methylococcaceae bacterium]|nr:hypothetical protein [Methylococcaceae bacterium]
MSHHPFRGARFGRSLLPFALPFLLVLSASPARADVSLRFTLHDAKGELDAEPLVLVKPGMALLRENPEKKKRELLYQQANRAFIIVDHKHRRVTTVNEQSVVNLVDQAQQMFGMMKGVSDQLALLPPEQRAKVENLLGGIPSPKSSGKSAPAIQKLSPAGQGNVAGLPCRRYQATGPGGPKADLCLANATEARVAAADAATLRDMQALALKLAREAAPVADKLDLNVPTLGNVKLDGILLALRDLSGANGFDLNLAELKTEPVDELPLRVPEDYQPRQLSIFGH